MAQPQIVIIYDENGYIRDLVKYLDNTLTDDDILSINGVGLDYHLAYEWIAKTFVAPYPIVVTPYGQSYYYDYMNKAVEKYYPDILLCQPYFSHIAIYGRTDFPVIQEPSNGFGTSHIITGSGLDGVHKWVGSSKIEFIVDSNGFSKNTFAITDITQQSGGKIRIFHDHTYINYYLVAYEPMHITGVTGFGNNPNGFCNVWGKSAAGVTPKWIDVKFVAGLGGGTYGGGATGHFTFLSDTSSVVGVKLNKIKRAREFANGSCSWWEARYLARLYSSSEGDKTESDGYGDITSDTVTDAIAHSGEIPDDPYLILGETGELSYDYNSALGKVFIQMPTVENVLSSQLIQNPNTDSERVVADIVKHDNNEYENEAEPFFEGDYRRDYSKSKIISISIKQGTTTFAYRGVRHSNSTELSEGITVTADEYSIPDYEFGIGDTVYALTKNKYTNILQINESEIIDRERYIDDSAGLAVPNVTEYYTLSDKNVVEKRFIGFTKNHLFYKMSGIRLNEGLDMFGTVQYLTLGTSDVCGLNISFTDLTNTDFTGWYIHGTSFLGCTMAENADTKEKLRSIVAGYDSETTVWTDGTLLSAD